MSWWHKQILKEIRRTRIETLLYKRYVADINIVMVAPEAGLDYIDGEVVMNEERDLCDELTKRKGDLLHERLGNFKSIESAHLNRSRGIGELPVLKCIHPRLHFNIPYTLRGSVHGKVNLKNGRNEMVFDRLWYHLSILLLVAIGAKLICSHGGLQIDKKKFVM